MKKVDMHNNRIQESQIKNMRNNLFKQTEIGRIPKEWEVAQLVEVAKINKEAVDPVRAFPNSKFLYIDIDSVGNGTGVISSPKEIVGEKAPSRARRVIHRNDVLMSTVRPYLKAFAIVPKKLDGAICSTGFAVLTCKENLSPHYLLHTIFSKAVINQCNKMMVGGQYPALSSSQVGKIKLPLPPLPEQQKIAEILSTADEAIQKVDEAIEKTQRLKQGLMSHLLTKGIGHKEFKETEIGRIPKEWEVVEIKNIGKVITGKTPPTSNQEFWNGEIPFITPVDIQEAKYVNKAERNITLKGAEKVGTLLPKDTVLVVCIGSTIGKVALTYSQCISNQQINAVIVGDDNNSHYVYYAISFKSGFLRSFSGTAAVPIIKKSLFETLKLPLAPLPEQQEIADILGSVDEKLDLLKEKKERFKKIKKGLMNDLLTGQKRVKVS
ncbi:MAG: restriction endonuclease subunit S [Nitrospirota bacterium]